MKPAALDLSDHSIKYAREKMGELVDICLGSGRVAIFVLRSDGVVTVLHPSVFSKLDPVHVASALLDSWTEEQIEEFLGFLERGGSDGKDRVSE